MSYPTGEGFLQELLSRKELYSLRSDPNRNFREPTDVNDQLAGRYLRIHSHQLFVRNFMNPNTDYRRLHLKHDPGTGKTLAAVSIAQEFISVYKKLYTNAAAKLQTGRRVYSELDQATPTVFVLGFGGTKAAFVRELMRYPEFGFITAFEKEELLKRQRTAETGLPDDIKHLKEYYSFIKKRITNKGRGGFYKFFGYDEFVNRLFLSDKVKLTDLEALTLQRIRAGESITLEDVMREHIANGTIQVNTQLIDMFENSLLICDEIHNTYNMNMKNNRGVAIQFILDTVQSLRFLSLSATPINNSPTEVVELINYLVPTAQKITKRDLFANSRTLLPGKQEEIGRLTRGRISFLQDANIKYFPKRVFKGKPIILPSAVDTLQAGAEVPYLKFIECPMSELHQTTYNNYVENQVDTYENDTEENNTEENIDVIDENAETAEDLNAPKTRAVPTDGYAIYDIVFPDPTSNFGCFRSGDVRGKLLAAPQEWRDKNQIAVKKYSANNYVITGEFLHRKNIGKYSTKCAELLDTVMSIISSAGSAENCAKIMIYHERVKMSGVLLIQELLRTNGMIDENSEPVDSTLCCICAQPLESHSSTTHDYRPVRFVVAHSDVDKAIMDQSLAKYNAPNNSFGLNYMILIGSKIIKESYDFKDIQHVIATSRTTNIPVFIQMLGRSIRKNSHENLPPEKRVVNVYVLISTVNKKYASNDPISPEVYQYISKLLDYIVIQNIEREFNRNAIDADIHRDITMTPDLRREYFDDNGTTLDKPRNMLGNLYFDPALEVPHYTLGEISTTTFNAYRYYEEEIKLISYLIKRLFLQQPVWTYDDLWATVRAPPFGVEVNPALFAENNFVIALHNLVSVAIPIVSVSKRADSAETLFVERLFDYSERYIYIAGDRHKIEQVGKYYVLFPVADLPTNPVNTVHSDYVEHVRDRERAMIKDLVAPSDKILVDVETYLRRPAKNSGARINIDAFVKSSRADINYTAKRAQFVKEYTGRNDIMSFLVEYSANFQMAFAEEAIIFAGLSNKDRTKIASNIADLYEKVIELLDKFNVIVYLAEVAKYKDTAKQYKHGLPKLPPTTPLGYMTAKSVRLFDADGGNSVLQNTPETIIADIAAKGKWLEISKIALNRHTAYKENDIIIGYLETTEDGMRFKLRKPVHKIKDDIARDKHAKITKSELEGTATRAIVGDTRLIERGIVCNTKNKYDLLQIIASLGVSTSKLSKTDIRIRKLCEIIKTKLLENEIKERQRDSRYKYVYAWWDENINIGAMI
jgi:hypothetical protein